jgi:Ca2+/H+ antiporter, TMEM165/GDT1 family
MISFKAVVIEGMEVVFFVIAVGATGHMLLSASLGALTAGLLVILLGLVLHKPLARIPENTLKFSVGVLLSAFGVFWIGEGLHLPRFGEDRVMVGPIFVLAVQPSVPSALSGSEQPFSGAYPDDGTESIGKES